jgi:phthiocerol/phenolphthiocerol synthesis type-I polyketide synthase D
MTPRQDRDHGADTSTAAGPAGIEALVRRLVSDVCGMDPERIEADRPLIDCGLSSRDAVGITGALEEALGRSLPVTLLWEHPSLTSLVRRLVKETPQLSGPDRRTVAGDTTCRVAVVGVGCRLPRGVGGPDAFWDLLIHNGDAVGEVPATRWQDCGDDMAAAAANLSASTRWGAFLDDVSGFDAQFFGITPREAQLMDPQQRLLLEVAWEALDHAGMPAPTLRGSSTGVYVGLSSLEYGFLTTADLSRVNEWTSTGSAGSIVANRVSYAFDLRGPSLTVDTACSSSLVALHQACRGLRSGECDTALAAGVNVLLSPVITASFDQAGVLAPGGRCKPFDAAADGIVRGEGCGVVVLKRLDDALRDGHPILAVIRGTAVNSDGGSAGMVAPNPAAQQALLRAALRDAGVDAGDVDYIEAHGTGTLLGDPIEAGALSAVLARHRPADRPLLIGSVKSNLGHLEGAAGITGVIKTVLSLQNRELPATLHFQKPNPHIDFTAERLRVVSEPTPWPNGVGRPARAGVSAFGFGGTNAHVVLEQWDDGAADLATPPDEPATPADGPQILLVSARSTDRVADAALGLADWLTGPAGLRTSMEDLTWTLGSNRYGPACAAVVGRDREAIVGGLLALGQKRPAKGVVGPRVTKLPSGDPGEGPVFVFSGYGSQWTGMGRRLLAEDDEFAAAVHELDPVFEAEAGRSLSRLISDGVPLTDVAQAQPLLYGLQLALAGTWQAYGVEPAAVVGHSMGEVAAAVVAGALDPGEGLRVIVRRAELLGAVDAGRTGAMAAVGLRQDERAETLARFPGVEIAVDASPLRCTVTGPADAVGALVAELEANGTDAHVLDVGGAGHSAAVDEVLPALRSAFADIRCRPPVIPWYGTVHDDPREVPRADADYWCDNARRPVRFRQAVAAALAEGHGVFLEISPHPIARVPVCETLDAAAADSGCLVLPTMLRDSDEPQVLRTTLAALHTAGVQRSPELLWPTGRRTSLPTTPWRHTRHWVDRRARAAVHMGGHPLLGTRLDVPGTRRALWRGEVGTDGWYSPEQQVHGTSVLTLGAVTEMILAATTEVFDAATDGIVVHDLLLDSLLPLDGSTPVTTLLDPTGPGRAMVTVHTRSAAGTWTRHASAAVEIDAPDEDVVRNEPEAEAFDFAFSPPHTLGGLPTPWQLHPAMLDACLRVPASVDQVLQDALPVAISKLRVRGSAGAVGVCRVWPSPYGDYWVVRLADADETPVFEADGVVLRVPDAGEVPLPVRDKAYEITWEPDPLGTPGPAAPTDWLLLSVGSSNVMEDDFDRVASLCTVLRRTEGGVTMIHCDAGGAGSSVTGWLAALEDEASPGVVLLCTEPPGTNDARDRILTAVDATRVLADTAGSGRHSRLFLVTECAAPVNEQEESDPDGACLSGLLRVLALEHPELRPCLVDIDHTPGAWDDLARELIADSDADHVAWRGGARFTARLVRTDPGEGAARVLFARPHGAYIVTGGLSGLGLATARRLAECGAGRLVLNGRRPPSTEAEAVLGELRALGTEVEVVLGDIAEQGTARDLVAAAVWEGHTLRGVAHAAGVLRDATISGLTPQDLDTVFRPKVEGGRHLDEATVGHDLDWWLVFSSAAALLGSPGQAAYAAANAWVDALVNRRRARGQVGQSIAWGPWTGAGAAPDMTAFAIEPLTPDEGLDALQLIVGGGRPFTGVVHLDAERVVRAFPGIESVPFFAGLMSGTTEEAGDWSGVDELRGLDSESALAAVCRRLALRTAMVMGFDGQEIDTTAPLTELGLDSLMAVRIRNAVKQDFGTVLPQTLLLRGGSLDEVAAALLDVLDVNVKAHGDPAAEDGNVRRKPPVPRTVRPRDAAERLVAGVWAQLSGHPARDVHQELRAVRDNLESATDFTERIRARLGGNAPAPSVEQIRSKPTVAAVADLIRPVLEGSGVDGSSLRVLRDPRHRTDSNPLFVFHPAGGSTSVFLPLTALLPLGLPVFGLDRVDSLVTVEDKARHYATLIRQAQRTGPYRLLGWSFGGCLAYQTAIRLREMGEEVGYLGLIDTILPAALPGPASEEILMERFARFAEYVETAYGRRLELPYEHMADMDEQEQLDTLMRHLADAGLDMSPGVLEHQRTSYIDARIGERYRPRPYPDPVVLYRAQEAQALTTAIDPRYLRDDADLGWAPLCPGLTVVPVPGDHLSLIDPPHVDVIARHLITAL